MKLAYLFLLPGVGFGLGLLTHEMTDWILNRSYASTDQLQTNFYPKTWFVRSLTITSIDARVDIGNDVTEVTLAMTQDTGLQQLEFKFPFTEPSQLEATLARQLNTTETSIRSLVSYRFD